MIFKILSCFIFVFMFQNIAAQTPGSPYFIPTGNPTSNGSAVVSAYSCSTNATGTLAKGVAAVSIIQTITATVTTVGTYSISTTTANGITFSGSGTFTGTGLQNIELFAFGTPTAAATSVTFTLNTTPSCSFTRNILEGSSNGTAVISAFTNCATASVGTITLGTIISGVSQTITANVQSVGTYSIIAFANDVIFAASGTFTVTGLQNIVLTATGTPTASGSAVSFALNTTPNCSFTRSIIEPSSNGSAVISAFSCNTASSGTLTSGTAVTGVTQTITATVVTPGTYSITTNANGVTFAATGTFSATGAQNIVLTASGTPTSNGTHTFTLNTTPNCSFNRTTVLSALPANITLSAASDYYIASIYDLDYSPYSMPTSAAQLPSGTTSEVADGINETTALNIQGTLSTTGVTIKLPYTVVNSSVSLPAYSQTIAIPASYTEDGISRNITFSYNAITLGVGSATITATLKAVGGPLNVKKLDIQSGIGNDYLGILLAQFAYSTNNSGGIANFEFRAVSGIPDRNFGLADNNGDINSHKMIYLPVNGADGKVWLNNNLGASYSNLSNGNFNPGQQATSFSDHLAYGSLFQWGRAADGHELITYSNGTTGTPVSNWSTTTLSSTVTPSDTGFITNLDSSTFYNWCNPSNNNLWQGVNGINNPCPFGFRLPTETEFNTLINAASITTPAIAASSSLKITLSGQRHFNLGTYVNGGEYGRYWTSTTSANVSRSRFLSSVGGIIASQSVRAYGYSVRCIMN